MEMLTQRMDLWTEQRKGRVGWTRIALCTDSTVCN